MTHLGVFAREGRVAILEDRQIATGEDWVPVMEPWGDARGPSAVR